MALTILGYVNSSGTPIQWDSVAFGGVEQIDQQKNATLGCGRLCAGVSPALPVRARDRSQHYACCLAPRHLFPLFLRRVADAAQRRLPGDTVKQSRQTEGDLILPGRRARATPRRKIRFKSIAEAEPSTPAPRTKARRQLK